MTEHHQGDDSNDLSPDELLALCTASWAATTLACCPTCRQVRTYCPACGHLNSLRLPKDADLPAALPGCCSCCDTPGLITVIGWRHHQAADNHQRTSSTTATKAPATTKTTSREHVAHLERCLRSGDGQRRVAPRPATPSRRPLPPASQRGVAVRLRLIPEPDRCTYAAWREDLLLEGLVLPTAAALAASYRRLTGLGPVLHPRRGSAMYSEAELVACLTELRIPLPADFVLPGSLLHHFHRWLLVELRTVRGDT